MWEILLWSGGGASGALAAIGALHAWGRRPLRAATFDAIIVAGCAVLPDGRPSPALARRVALAAALYAEGRATRLVLTGGVGRHPPSEAAAAADLAERLGVPRSALCLEEASTNTEENARFAAQHPEVHGGMRVLVVSDAYHILRCERVFSRYFAEVRGAGAPVPLASALRLGARELASLTRYAVLGRLSGRARSDAPR